MTIKWQTVPFSEVLTPISRPEPLDSGKMYRILGMRWYAQGLFIKEDKPGHEIQASVLYRVERGDFVYNRLFAWKGSFGIVEQNTVGGYVSGEFPCFCVNTEKADPKYIHLYLSQEPVWNEIARISSGQTNISRLRLKVPTFLSMRIPLPPIEEQRRIGALIESLFSRVSETQRLRRDALEKTGKLMDYQLSKILLGLKGLSKKPLIELTVKIGSGSTPTGGRASYPTSGIPFIRSMNVRMRRFQSTDIVYIDTETHKSMSSTIVKPNDVLLNITGASIGRVTCAPIDFPEANVNQHVAIIRPKENLKSRFLMYWLSQPSVQEFINTEQKGATRQGFTKAQIEQLEIPVPQQDEQLRIIAYLDRVQAQVETLHMHQIATQNELNALMPSILDKTFKGDL